MNFILSAIQAGVLACIQLVVRNAISCTTPKGLNRLGRFSIQVGSWAISVFMTMTLTEGIKKKVVELKEEINKIITQIKEIKQTEKTKVESKETEA